MAEVKTNYPPNTVLRHAHLGVVFFVRDCGTIRQACIEVRRIGETASLHVDPIDVVPMSKRTSE